MGEKKQEKKEFQLVQGHSTFKMEIPEAVEAKIRHLCSRVHDVEWSGVLFYKAEGSMEDGSFKVICLDIFVMDIGTSGFTDYDDSPEIAQYRVAHRDLLLQPGVYEALIHSHNHMASFFSGTDTATLKQEGSTVNHFVSLIVNNAGTYTARVTRKLVRKVKAEAKIKYTESAYYNSFENTTISIANDKVTEKEQVQEKNDTVVEWFPLDIVKADVSEQFKDVDARLNHIRETKINRRHNLGGVIQTPNRNDPRMFPNTGATYKPATTSKMDIAFSQEVKTPDKNLIKTSQPVQGSLFPDMEKEPNQPYPLALMESYNETIIKSLCMQLLTGCILADENNNINLEEWVKNMDDTYEKRFGSLNDKDSYQAIESWVENMVDQLIYTTDEDLEERVFQKYNNTYDESDISEVCAYDMVRFLEDLPESLVKEIMIEELYTYMPNVKDFI